MIIYNNEDIHIIGELLFKISEKSNIMNVLSKSFSMVYIRRDHPSISGLLEKFKIKFLSPLTLFMQDTNGTFLNNKNLIIQHFDGLLEVGCFCDAVLDLQTKYGNSNNNSSSNNNFGYDYRDEEELSRVELMEKQKRELEEAEKEVYIKQQKQKEEEMLKQKKKEELKLKEENLRKKVSSERKNKEQIRKNLPNEPDKTDPNCSLIMFRLPNGKTIERRFLKTWQIVELYLFINSLDNVLEEEDTEYDLITPFPPKTYDAFDETLEAHGLFPNAVLQVREK